MYYCDTIRFNLILNFNAMIKRNLYSTQEVLLADVAKSLSHPARVKILKLLMLKSPQSAAEIVSQIPLAQATVSQHLSELKHAQLIKDKKQGNKVFYSVNKPTLSKSFRLFNELFSFSQNAVQQVKLF